MQMDQATGNIQSFPLFLFVLEPGEMLQQLSRGIQPRHKSGRHHWVGCCRRGYGREGRGDTMGGGGGGGGQEGVGTSGRQVGRTVGRVG